MPPRWAHATHSPGDLLPLLPCSHLQKYRQQEGVTFVAHAPRAPASRRGASAAGFGDWEPAIKRSRSGGAAVPAAALPGFGPAPGNFWPAPAGQPAAAEPVQHFLQALAGTAPPPMPLPPLPALPEAALPPMPAPARPPSPPAYEHAEKLHTLADLALAQQEELLAAEAAAQEAAEQLDGLGDRLASVASASGAGEQQSAAAGQQQPGSSGISSRAGALVEEQQQLTAELRLHLAQQAALLERLAALRRAADELLARPELAAAGQPAATDADAGPVPLAPLPGAQAPALGATAAAQRLAAEQAAAGVAGPAMPLPAVPAAAAAAAAAPAAGMAPPVASLLASIAAAAASGSAAGAVAPPAGVSMEEFLPLVQQQIQLQLQHRLFRLGA